MPNSPILDAALHRAALPSRHLFPSPTILVQHDDESGGLALLFQGHFITREEFDSFVQETRQFFDFHGDDFVKSVNDGIDQDYLEREIASKTRGPGKPGIVYLLRGRDGLYKIGLTRKLPQRIKQIETAWSTSIELIHKFEVQNAERLECELHIRYNAKAQGNEWFALSAEEVAEIQAMKRD